MYTREGFLGIFAGAGLPAPAVIELLSGATLLRRRAAAPEPDMTGPAGASGRERRDGVRGLGPTTVKSFIWVGWILQW